MSCRDQTKHMNDILSILGVETNGVNFSNRDLDGLTQKTKKKSLLANDLLPFSPNLATFDDEALNRRRLLALTKNLALETKGMKFHLKEIIQEFCGVSILPLEKMPTNSSQKLTQALVAAQKEIQIRPLLTARPNEAGNLFEAVLERELVNLGFVMRTGLTKTRSGYPDLQIIIPETQEIAYLECKTHNRDNISSSLRTFYLTPGLVQKKVDQDGYHILCALTLARTTRDGKIAYMATEDLPTMKNLSDLQLEIKYEYNASNKDMYQKLK